MMVPLDPMGPPIVNGGGGAGGGGGPGRGRQTGPAEASGGISTISIATGGGNASFQRTDDEYRNVLMRSEH